MKIFTAISSSPPTSVSYWRLHMLLTDLCLHYNWITQPSFDPLRIYKHSFSGIAGAIEPYEIQGPGFLSPYNGQTLSGIHGIVTAKGPSGWWITGNAGGDEATSDAVYVYSASASVRNQTAVGDEIIFNGKVLEYRADTGDLFFTEITSPSNITKLSAGNVVKPIVLGVDRSPPTEEYTVLDKGNVFGYPNNVTTISMSNLTAQPRKYGLDFWSSLEGELVTIKNPVALGFDTQYSDFWVHGSWPVTGKNKRGGLTMTMSPDGVVDANPEAIIIGSPLDGTKNPDVVTMGTTLQDITGVVTFAFDFYRILPLTSAKVVAYPTELPSPTELKSLPIDDTGCQKITFGDYNVENLNPQSKHLPNVSHHIAHFLGSPDVLFLQEVQDNSGPTDDGVVSSDKTLSALAVGIVAAGGANYSWAVVDPVNNADGGEPGGNIRVAFLYRPEVVRLVNENVGTASNSTQVQNVTGQPELSLNPGRINPTSPVWTNSRKPVVCLFETIATKDRLFAINVHQSSKGGSSPIHGDPRTPVNGAIDARIGQAKETANFVSQILAVNPKAKIIISGDFNEFLFTKAVFAPFEGLVKDADVVVNIDPAERYTYQYDMSSQQLDHALVSSAIDGSLEFHHVHVNTWAPSYEARISDHDPTVGRLKMCKTQGGNGGNCSYKIESWCAAPLPSFHDFPSCLKSVLYCFNENAKCYQALPLPTSLQCTKHALQCVRYAEYCTKNCISKGTNCSSFPALTT